MDNGIVRNWDDMEHVWDHTFNERLKLDTKHAKVNKHGQTSFCSAGYQFESLN